MTLSDQNHIASAFDRDIEEVQAHIMKMGGLVEQMLLDAANALVERDEERAAKVVAEDKRVDALEIRIQEEVARLIALRAPTAIDLRLVLSALSMSNSLERIGDYAKNLAKRTKVLTTLPSIDNAAGSLRRMSSATAKMLSDVLDAYLRGDVDIAEAVRLRDEEIDQMYNALFREFLTHMMEDPRNISACMHLHFIAKNIERAGDHITSIAEGIIYHHTGEMPDDDRPKSSAIATSIET
jgi:phosphate transport system protein